MKTGSMIELLEACVRIPSLSEHEQDVAAFLCDDMRARGFDRTFIDDAGNAVGIVGEGSRQIVLLGHMDTVGGDVPVRYEDGKLFGRGTVDAKGPLCAFVLAVAAIAQSRFSNHPNPLPATANESAWQLIVIGAVEEESATSKGARFAATQYAPDYCIIGEPSGGDGITLGYKGRLLAQARFEQAGHHTAMPGPNASELAVLLWNELKALAQTYNADKPKAFDQIMPSLRKIQSGDDGLREWCDMLMGIRLPIEFGPDALQNELENAKLKIESAEPSLAQSSIRNSQLSFSGREHAYRSSKDSPLARAFVDAIRAEKMRPAFKLKTGTADFNVVGPVWNCPIVAYGPGDSMLDHTPNEHVAIDEFEKSVKVLTRVLRALMSA